MTTTSHAIAVMIDGTNRTALLMRESLNVNMALQNGASVCSFVLDDVGTYTPAAWDVVTISVGSVRIFGGYIAERNGETVGTGSDKRARWTVTCRDWTMLFDKVIVNASYVDLTDAGIVTNLINTYLTGDGFTLTEAQITRYNLDKGFENLTVREALNRLASEVEASWYVDPDQQVYWFNRYSPPNAAFSIDTSGTLGAGYVAPKFGGLRRTLDDSAVFNRITVFGNYIQGDRVSDITVTNASGLENTFELEFYPHSVSRVEVTLANGRETLQGSYIGYEPDNILYGETGDAARIVYVLVNREKRTVKVRTPLGVPIASSNVTITYYKARQIKVQVDDAALQATHGRVLEAQIYNQYLANDADATTYGEALIKAWGHGKESMRFDVTEFGLLPGTRLIIYSPEVGADADIDYRILGDGDYRLLEDGTSYRELESDNNLSGVYVVQNVTYRAIKTPAGYMVIATIQCGEYEQSIIDILAQLTGGAGAGALPSQYLLGRLSDAASDLGIVVAGRAVFTDGGTAALSWTDYGAHTGVVVGLNDSGTPATGELVILETGIERLRLGKLDGIIMTSTPTVTPTGYGIWTDNGYFEGVVASSSVQAGTIDGAMIYGGTVRTSSDPVNSSNPGVQMTAAGLFGYGTAGLTFALYSDPALKPYFSSGTITNVVYEVTTASVIRTGTVNPKIQIDNSGIFAYAPGTATTPTFSVDAASGVMMATGGVFSGDISASTISGGTVTAGAMTAMAISGGTITAPVIRTSANNPRVRLGTAALEGYDSGGTVKFSVSAKTGLLTASGATISGSISASTISGGTVSGGYISGGTISGAVVSGGTILAGMTFGTGDTSLLAGTTSTSGGRFYWKQGTANVVTTTGYYSSGALYEIGNQYASSLGTVILQDMGLILRKNTGEATFTISASTGRIANNLLPDESTALRTIGNDNYRWNAIYLNDLADGSLRAFGIHNGTVIIS